MKKPSNLQNLSIEEIEYMAENIASEMFVKYGNKSVSFTECNDLRIMVGGRYESCPELSKVVITAYNRMQMNLILSNL